MKFKEIKYLGPLRLQGGKIHWYRGVPIFPKNVHGMYSARVNVPGGGRGLAADTLAGIKSLIKQEYERERKPRA
jgi:hypothetical protein